MYDLNVVFDAVYYFIADLMDLLLWFFENLYFMDEFYD